MPLSVRLDQKTESLIGRLARKRRQTKSEVIRDAIGVLAKQREKSTEKKRPCESGGSFDWLRDSGGANLSREYRRKICEALAGRARARRSRLTRGPLVALLDRSDP
jgi:Arc/MetJ-type ribon-helix-helix transcriptional regulator